MSARPRIFPAVSAIAIVLVAVISGCTPTVDGASPSTGMTEANLVPELAELASTQGSSEQFLFTLQAASGATVDAQALDGEDERFTLRLSGVDPVTKFSDRPFRDAMVMSVDDLVSSWASWFADSPPNAVLTYDAGAGLAPQSIVVTLTEPEWNLDTSTITFTAVRIYRTTDPNETVAGWIRPKTPAIFTTASLFIDNVGAVHACQIRINAPLSTAPQVTPIYGTVVQNDWASTGALISLDNVAPDPSFSDCKANVRLYLAGCPGQYVDMQFSNSWNRPGRNLTDTVVILTGYNGAGTKLDSASINASGRFTGNVVSSWIVNLNCG